jgi:hypothetical protein
MPDSPKTLDSKLARITTGQYSHSDFIIADAKDGDMAFGLMSPAPARDGSPRPRDIYLKDIRDMTRSGLVDVMLMSASSGEILANDGLFDGSGVTPAVRMNDTTDIWSARGSCYRASRSIPFATADIDAVSPFCKLGLYSMTFSNHTESDRTSLLAYRDFRHEIRAQDFNHFLEVFNPAFDIGIAQSDLGDYINDMIIKAVAGITRVDAPLFLKIQFNGAKAMRELASYDPQRLIVGILGGAKGTTRDTFELALQAEDAGARVALFGRKINLAEAPLELVRLMRATIERQVTPQDAVRQYHDYLGAQDITPVRTLADDIAITDPVLQH